MNIGVARPSDGRGGRRIVSPRVRRAKCVVVATVVLSWLCSRIGGLRFGGIVFFPSPEGTTAASPGQTETSPGEFSCSPGLIRHPRFIGRVVRVAGRRRVAEAENSRGLPRLISASVSRRSSPSQSARPTMVIATVMMATADGPIKTFPLRGIKDSPPYMHDGRLLTLEDTVEFFNLVLNIHLTTKEKTDLAAFLHCL